MATIQSAVTGLASAVTTWGLLKTGTSVTFTNGSDAVTGVGTTFTTDFATNDYILGKDNLWYQVLLVTDNTNLTLTASYAGTTGSPTYILKQPTAIPAEGDKVNIYNTVTVDGTYIWGDDTTTAINVKSGGILKASRSTNSQLTAKGNIQVEAGGEWDWGKSGDAVPNGITAVVKLNYSASITESKYGLVMASTGKFFSYGDSTKLLTTTLNGALIVGATSAVVTACTGWAVGDIVCFEATGTAAYGKGETKAIATIDTGTKTITWTGGLSYAHADGAVVDNHTQNVEFVSYDISSGTKHGYIDLTFANTASIGAINYTWFYHLGGTTPGLVLRTGGSNSPISSFTNNTFTEHYYQAILTFLAQPSFDINSCHFYNTTAKNAGSNAIFFYGGSRGSVTNCTFLKTTSSAVTNCGGSQGGVAITFNNCLISGGATGITIGPGFGWVCNNCRFGAMNYYAVYHGYTNLMQFNNCTFGNATTPIPSVIGSASGGSGYELFVDCLFNYTSTFNASATSQYLTLFDNKYFVANKNASPSVQEIYTYGGNFFRDNTTYKVGTNSVRYEGIASNVNYATLTWGIVAPNGKPITVTGYLRKNSSYGSTTRPYVTLTGLGITTSTYTMTDVNDTWEQFTVSGTNNLGTDGVLTLTAYFQSNSTSGYAYINGISAPTPQAVNTGELAYWQQGQPVQFIAANYVAAIDIWNVLTTDCTVSNSQGVQANNTAIKADDASILRGVT